MKNETFIKLSIALFAGVLVYLSLAARRPEGTGDHRYNSFYRGKHLDRVSFPIGGIGAGMFCLDGNGSISHLSVRNKPELFNEPVSFAAISVKGYEHGAKVLEGQVPQWKMFGTSGSGTGSPGKLYGLPRFSKAEFLARFPFATIGLDDADIPLKVTVTGWSPFIPGDADNSSLPCGILEYSFKNTTAKSVESVFSWNSRDILTDWAGQILPADKGFLMTANTTDLKDPGLKGFSVFADDEAAVVDYCWFRGEWFDPYMMLWKNIENCLIPHNAAVTGPVMGASIYVPFVLKPGEEKTISVNFCWYLPDSGLKVGNGPVADNQSPLYAPWYSGKFKNIEEVIAYWKKNKSELRKISTIFSDSFYSSTLPAEVIEAVASNLTIIKSPTVLRQTDGKLWCWEGCGDNEGSCPGSCTHVWNYAQAIAHLFPALERTLRETEFLVSQNELGHQNFRSNLPISVPSHNFYAAADGQLGGILKVYRDWRISGNTEWMKKLYPHVRRSLDYCIETWDPGHKGYLEEPHHNTYDIEFWGPDGMCTSIYLGALTAIIEMCKAEGTDYSEYETLLSLGKAYMEKDLYDGEYFVQRVKTDGLRSPNPVDAAKASYRTTYSPEALEILKAEGPKYQYGRGCLSDGIIGMWMASVCGLPEIVDDREVRSHLDAVYRYNFKSYLIDHVNPERSTFASAGDGGLLLCTWPKGGKLSLPFIYSNEVWSGVEYQVASHLMFKGEVEKGLKLVRACRSRYDGTVRNPFNEYECGSWYARAMSSYALLEGLTGVRYDEVDKTLYINTKIGDFTSFLATETGFGNVGLKGGKPFLITAYGKIEPRKIIVSGKEMPLKTAEIL